MPCSRCLCDRLVLTHVLLWPCTCSPFPSTPQSNSEDLRERASTSFGRVIGLESAVGSRLRRCRVCMQDPCLGWPDFPWASVIATAAALLTNAIEFAAGQYFGSGGKGDEPMELPAGCGHTNGDTGGHRHVTATEPLLLVLAVLWLSAGCRCPRISVSACCHVLSPRRACRPALQRLKCSLAQQHDNSKISHAPAGQAPTRRLWMALRPAVPCKTS